MTRTLLAVLLLSAAAHAQAPAIRPPATPPVVTPNYFPGSTGNPVHTPAGAGASHGALASPEKEVPRSKNWRPGGKGPELMAPDDVTRASSAPLAAITRAEMEAVPEGMSGRTWNYCREHINNFLDSQYEMKTQPERVRLCVFATLLDYCVWGRGSPKLPHPDPQDVGIYDSAAAIADIKARERRACGETFGTDHKHPLYGFQEAMRQKYKAHVKKSP